MEADHNLNQFLNQFQTEDECIYFLYQMKWPSGFICPRCSHRQAYTIQTRRLPLYECMSCRHQTSLTVNTVMEGSRTQLRKWLTALFLASRISSAISALQLSQIIHVTYKTAWLMLHKIRHAMSEADASVKLYGFVQVNDFWYGHTRHSSFQRDPREHPLLIGATMTESETPSSIKITQVSDDHLIDRRILSMGKNQFMNECVEAEATEVEFILGRYISSKHKKLYPLFKQMNQWIYSTFHGISQRHLQAYLHEFCYRFNAHQESKCIFEPLAQLCANSRTISYAALIS